MLPAGFASPAFLPTGIYHHCRHQLHAPRFFTSFRMTIPAGRLHGAWRLPSFPCTNDTIATPPPCHFDRSGEISLLQGTSRTTAGDLSTQSFNRFQAHLPPLRHAAPLEMTDATGRLASLEKDGNAVTPPCHFDRSGAKWRNLPPLYCPLASLSRLPAGMYLSSLPSLASCTEILHFVQNDDPGRKAPWCLASAFFPLHQ